MIEAEVVSRWSAEMRVKLHTIGEVSKGFVLQPSRLSIMVMQSAILDLIEHMARGAQIFSEVICDLSRLAASDLEPEEVWKVFAQLPDKEIRDYVKKLLEGKLQEKAKIMNAQTGEKYRRQHLYTEWPNGHGGSFFVAHLTFVRRPGRGGVTPQIPIEAYDSNALGGQIGYFTPNEHGIGPFIREIVAGDAQARKYLGTVQVPGGFRERLKEALTAVLGPTLS